jgi:hypothetical protein
MSSTGDDRDARKVASEGAAMMAEGAARLLDGVDRLGAAWVERVVRERLDQWGGLDAEARDAALGAAREAGARAASRVCSALRELVALDPAVQRATPLEILRTLRAEATTVLRAAGVPPIERDAYEERAFPDDVYGIVLRTPADLGDDELGGALLAWGLGKTKVLRAGDPDA